MCTHPSSFIHFDSDDLHSFLSSRFPPHMVPPHHTLHTTGIPHPAIVTPTVKQESSQSDVGSLHSSWVSPRCCFKVGVAFVMISYHGGRCLVAFWPASPVLILVCIWSIWASVFPIKEGRSLAGLSNCHTAASHRDLHGACSNGVGVAVTLC